MKEAMEVLNREDSVVNKVATMTVARPVMLAVVSVYLYLFTH
jgi:hypothetical protein